MSTRDAFDEARLADALVAGDGAPVDPGRCISPDRIWDAARGVTGPAALHVVLDHAAHCADCALALRTAVELHGASGLGTPARTKSPWAWLTATLLRPEAALAYLLLLAVGAPLVLRSAASHRADASAMSAARVVGLESDVIVRGAGETKPVLVDPKGSDTVVLRLFVEPDDLDASAPLRVTLSGGGGVLIEKSFAAGSVGDSGTLDVTVDVRALPSGTPLTLTVAAGTERVFDRTFVVTGDGGR
jgi:hypothetical protein